jgi:ankyrin repeat protein
LYHLFHKVIKPTIFNRNKNKIKKDNVTALHIAAQNGKLNVIELLNDRNLDLNAQDKNGENALHYCCRCVNVISSIKVIKYLISCGIPINSQNKVFY